MERARVIRRFTSRHPCPVCGGHDTLARGKGVRCFGYYDSLGRYARCTRGEKAGDLPVNADGTYSHRLAGDCPCGGAHGGCASATAGPATPVTRRQQRFRSFFTLSAFLRRRHGNGTTIRHWIYRQTDGGEAFRVLRVDYRAPDGSRAKSYRPCHRLEDGTWRLSRPGLPLPLYNLPAILAAPPEAMIVLVEGEKCADLASAIGLGPVTTSAHGAKAPRLTEWAPLAGRAVALLGDADADGQGYVAQAAGILAALDPPARVRIVTLPDLAEGEDIEQFIEGRRDVGRTDGDILAELREMIYSS
jgi:hypothetical protein